MTRGNWLTQQWWFPAGTCVTWAWSQSHTLHRVSALSSSLLLHATRRSYPAPASSPPRRLTTALLALFTNAPHSAGWGQGLPAEAPVLVGPLGEHVGPGRAAS